MIGVILDNTFFFLLVVKSAAIGICLLESVEPNTTGTIRPWERMTFSHALPERVITVVFLPGKIANFARWQFPTVDERTMRAGPVLFRLPGGNEFHVVAHTGTENGS